MGSGSKGTIIVNWNETPTYTQCRFFPCYHIMVVGSRFEISLNKGERERYYGKKRQVPKVDLLVKRESVVQ